MGKVRVDRASNELGVDVVEVLGSVVEGADLRGAHKGEIQRIEEEHDILACVVSQLDLLEAAVSPSHALEGGSRQGYSGLDRVGPDGAEEACVLGNPHGGHDLI